ncbi:MAG: tyrosine-type recombinase/integrase [Pseudomonadota bacterium]|uniref:Tyrosine-type recombinase/integrase n=1 Tax=Candidatus Desulfatibia profunda TaxID=2841695 RepID=A0A8J6NT02_9BACT|nr:tyrosine-type recombinase/integrase [Candidatus Desulfatibia profunda]
MKNFESFLAPQLKAFMAYRQNLGYATKTLWSHLKTFDRYLKRTKHERSLLQPSFFLELRANLKMEPTSANRVLYTARDFFQFLVRKGLYTTNPLHDIPPLSENRFIPFVFSPDQLDQLLGAVCKRIRKYPKYYLKDLCVYLAIVLLARCGMRISEPLRLLRSHYRPDEKTLYIEKTKFKKDRLIPIPLSAADEINNYLAVRNALLGKDQNPYLLARNKQKMVRDYQIRSAYHQAVKDIGLNQARQIIGNTVFSAPVPHSLRHSFAVNTLRRVKEKGRSPQNALPVLAIYMGHCKYKHTIKYLKVLDAEQRKGLADFVFSNREDT